MTPKQKKMLIRIIASAAALAAVLLIPSEGILRFALFMVPYLIAGYDVLLKAVKGIRNLQPFDEYFLMAVATVGAIALAVYSGSGDYTEAVDSPNSFSVLTLMTPERFTEPLMTALPAEMSRGMLSPVSAAVSSEELPSMTVPSIGTFSPGFTTMTEPGSTSSGSTLSVFPSCSRFA